MEPEQFGPYRLEELIGRGGMGEVYRAFDSTRRRTVAVKVLPPELASDTQFQIRFRRESELAARLSEPHVIPIHDYGEIDGRLYIDMRLVAGTELGALLKAGGALPPQRAVHLVGQVAEALDAAHAEGLVHRDVKPSNVLVTASDFVYLVDFGVARSLDGDGTQLTATGSTVGTLSYMAPERFDGLGDHRVDVYALACVLFEVLTGRRPFEGNALPVLLNAHLNTPPPRPTDLRSELPRGLDGVIARGMAKNPDARFPSAGALADAARAALAPAVAPVFTPPPPGPRAVPDDAPTVAAPARQPERPPAAPPPGAWPPPAGSAPHTPPAARGAGRRRGALLAALAAAVVAAAVVAVVFLRPTASTAGDSPAPPSPGGSTVSADAIDLGGDPEYLTVAPDGETLYVTNSVLMALQVLDTESGAIRAEIPVGVQPQRVTVSPDGARAYVANLASSSVSVIDTATDTVVSTIPTGESTSPYEVAVSPDSDTLYITTAFDVLVVDADAGTVETIDFPSGSLTNAIAMSPDGATVYVASNDRAISVVDAATRTITATVDLPPNSFPEDVDVGADGSRLYVTLSGATSVAVIDTASGTVAAMVELNGDPHNAALSPDGGRLYVAYGSDTVAVIDTATDAVVETITVEAIPQDVAVAPDGRRAAVVYTNSSRLTPLELPGQ
jgi:YVTN family beta-propeller protein